MSQQTINQNQTRESYYYQPIEELIQKFNSNIDKGLSSSDIESRYAKYGYNELPVIKKSIWKVYLAPIFNFLIVILIITGTIIIILGEWSSTIITFTVVIMNSTTAIVQQYRAQKALESLRRIAALKTTVIRDGIQKEIFTKDLVPGDIVVLDQGDKVPADGRIIEFMNLSVNEAPLTGESEPVEKTTTLIKKDAVPVQKQLNMVFMGTYVNTGRGKALITGTGLFTEIGKISSSLNEMGSIGELPLTKKLNKLGYILGTIVIINLIILIIYKFTVLSIQDKFVGPEISKALVSSILRAMNIMPINLPLLTTLVLITGVLNMAQSGVIIKNLSAIESLGRVSVICSDKTGTITKNEMTVEELFVNEEEFKVSGSGYDGEGIITKSGEKVDLKENTTYQKFINSAVVNNNARLEFEDVKVRVKGAREKAVRKALGSPTEAALLVLAEKSELAPYDIKRKYEVLQEFSFTSEVKRMTTVAKLIQEKSTFAFSKGAPERLLTICSQIESNGKTNNFPETAKQKILTKIQERANQGYRTLAIAYKDIKNLGAKPKREEIEKDLVFLGFVAIMDPPRPGVKEAVSECQQASIKVVMITGDHPATAKTIAEQMGIFREGDLVIEGSQINNISSDDYNKVSVFARVEPADKELIVKKYQSQNKICAMTGDGINDALALRLANAGIAMGITGTDVAKEAADMVISDDNFTSIEKGVKIGRGLFSKIRTIIYFFICLNIMEAIIFFTYEFSPTFVLFKTEWQHIYIFGIVHSFPSLALVVDSHPKDIMKEPPRNEEELLNKNMWVMLLIHAFLMGLGIVLAIELTLGGIIPLNEWNLNPDISYVNPDAPLAELTAQKARTMFITTLYIIETNFIWTFRRPNQSMIKSFKEEFGITLFIITAFTLTIHAFVILFSYEVNNTINSTLGLDLQLNYMFLSLTDWLICIALALPGIFGIEVLKWYARKKNLFF